MKRAILSAMAGITDGEFAKKCLDAGAFKVCIGGFPIGKVMHLATKSLVKRGRKEFEIDPKNEVSDIFKEVNNVEHPDKVFINLRVVNALDLNKFLAEFIEINSTESVIEINAHCRQPEIINRGGGQKLIEKMESLSSLFRTTKRYDLKVSLKIRSNVIPDIHEFGAWITRSDIDYLHIDSYKPGIEGMDCEFIQSMSSLTDTKIIANNSINTPEDALLARRAGASYYSIARGSINNPEIFKNFIKI